jgi:hypothetical protein
VTHPAPLVPRRAATEEETPRGAARLALAAEEARWKVRITYAHGTSIGAQGQPTHLVECVAVRLRRGPLAGIGVWHDGKFSTAYVWSRWTPPSKVGARELIAFVKAQEQAAA